MKMLLIYCPRICPLEVREQKFCKMLLHFLTPSIEAGEEDYYHAAAAAMKVLPGQ